jgi:uncharacterized protein
VAQRRVSDIEISEQSGADHPIDRLATHVVAFVGRTLKGPIHRPVAVGSFAEFQQHFGGLWQPSTVSYAIEQFFENGGRRAYVVRVVNAAKPPTLTLAAADSKLVLKALNPGSREYLRASVDYDGIGQNEPDRFNLVVQRVRSPGSELIEEQEIFLRLTILPQSKHAAAAVLLESRLVRVVGAMPAVRPDRSSSANHTYPIGYTYSNTDGDDGAPLTNYDIIGSALDNTGLFALKRVENFNFLCIPPLTREQDVGLSTWLIASKLCAEQHAMLMVDPPQSWGTGQSALAALSKWPLRSENAIMYFPRIIAFDRLRGRPETFVASAAAAGALTRADEHCPVWGAMENDAALLRPALRPQVTLTDLERQRLSNAGVNTLVTVRTSATTRLNPRTLAADTAAVADWRYLSARRLAHFLIASIERGTRWLLFASNDDSTWGRAEAQVETFLRALHKQGAFAGAQAEDSYFVICDERVNAPHSVAAGKIKVLFGFAAIKPGDFRAYLVTHQSGSSNTRAVSANRSATAPRRLEWEIETAVLQAFV